VGDQLFLPGSETSNLAGMRSESAPTFGTAGERSQVKGISVRRSAAYCVEAHRRDDRQVSWTLLVVPELSVEAQQLLESKRVVACACCGRSGRVAHVIVKPEKSWVTEERVVVRRRHERMQL
jgi:hypothetical protein